MISKSERGRQYQYNVQRFTIIHHVFKYLRYKLQTILALHDWRSFRKWHLINIHSRSICIDVSMKKGHQRTEEHNVKVGKVCKKLGNLHVVTYLEHFFSLLNFLAAYLSGNIRVQLDRFLS